MDEDQRPEFSDTEITGERLRAARDAVGISLSALAARTNYSKTYLGQLETGDRPIRPEHVRAYSEALNVSVYTLDTPPTDPVRVAHEWLVSDSPAFTHSAAGRKVGASLATELEQRVVELRHLDDSVGGRTLYPVIRKELADIRGLVDCGSYTEQIGQRLLTVVGELSQLAGWVASDAGRYADAETDYLEGVSAASEAGDKVLAAQLFSSLSYQMSNVGNPADAALLARTAVVGARDATPVVRTLLLERVAWASARARDRDGSRRALDAVDDTYDSHSPDIAEPEWTYWLNRDEIDVMAGRCFVELRDPSSAEPLLSRAIDGYPADHAREVALYRTWLAEAYAGKGELDAARATIARARRAADKVKSSRLDRRVSEIERVLEGGPIR
ncbi:helix-turn-helix transcriptional regulator [Nocardia terpenica]|uniref:helix-turn-helix domain-containing protein n=1 Tax=Nocardia terpenica TaxID=455432 RepID=UPI0018961D29|nr:helix-turn-helix transcriptional regulator [Nocardia terpenica]MBF6060964.1 helix-turn-helix transcriptional regulator [Nocardia terpenica]MBF6111402.1 helix-turn-helix transcriptional regulator [Nocardia terpenica]MBF6118445.1 helix-turn-helix transcriptional regulator [Nocardia terpenica]MBF6155767.1 helix-turn-helix transcriptional regulator [Nocardia terpenica]